LDSTQKAYRLLDQVENLRPKTVVVLFNLGDIYEQLGDRDRALFWMKEAIDHGATLAKFNSNPGLKNLIADERFKEIIKRSDSIHQ